MRTKHCSRCGTTDHWTLQHCKVCGGLGHHALSHNKENKFRCKTCGQLGHNSKYHGEKATRLREHPVIDGRARCSVCLETGHDKGYHEIKVPKQRRYERRYDKPTPLEKILRHRLTAAFNRAAIKGFSPEIDTPFLVSMYEQQDGKCFYSGIPLDLVTGGSASLSIDRRDSAKGYTEDNVILVCSEINIMKNDSSEETFLTLCRAVAENHAKKP